MKFYILLVLLLLLHNVLSEKQKHYKTKLIGGGDHDYKSHGKLLGGDNHDYKPHKRLLGSGNHDYRPHGRMIGGGDHDYNPHGKKLLGRGDHDYMVHAKKLLGQGDHDYRPHGKLIGGDDHDYKPHKKLFGSGDHDYKPHGKLIGGGDHDYKLHANLPSMSKGRRPLTTLALFKNFMITFNKTYRSKAEYKMRMRVFKRNIKKAKIMQSHEKGTAEYGVTKFSDWTATEFRKLLGFRPHMKPAKSISTPAVIPDITPPKSMDWREKGVVTPVKNQGMCGSCWAFSVTGNVEGQWAIKHKKLYSLSEQELVDCDKSDSGCEGGLPESAYKAIQDIGGLETETSYPYDAEDEKCHFESSKAKVKVNGSVELPRDEEDIAKWLTVNGPISIGINANALQFYMGGVSHPLRFLCDPENLDHGMLIVGYGMHVTKYLHRKQPYWLVKNSWGADWGEKGYYRVYRGDGTCGVNRMATSAVVP